MIPFRVTVATNAGRLTYFVVSSSSYEAWLEAASLFEQPHPISVVRA